MAKPCCERSEPASAEDAVSEGVGSGIPTKIGCKRASGRMFVEQGESCPERKTLSSRNSRKRLSIREITRILNGQYGVRMSGHANIMADSLLNVLFLNLVANA